MKKKSYAVYYKQNEICIETRYYVNLTIVTLLYLSLT